jgi:Mce-associated membrane protein
VDEAAGLSEDAPADATLEAEVPVDEAPEAGDEGIGADDTHEDAEEADWEPEPEGDRRSAPGGVTGAARRLPLVPVCLGVVTVILGGLATWFGLEAGSVGNGVDTRNVALVNAAATREVSQQIDAAVNTIFSYNYADTAKTKQAAASLLTGKASQQYNTLFKLVTADAPQEKLVLTTTVTNSGVESLEGNLARLLIFVNQSDTSNATHKTTTAGAMFAVSAVREGGSWKIASIDEFAGT